MKFERGVFYTTGYGCKFVLQIGFWVWYFGDRKVKNGRGPRLEIFTPFHWFRWSKGYRNAKVLQMQKIKTC